MIRRGAAVLKSKSGLLLLGILLLLCFIRADKSSLSRLLEIPGAKTAMSPSLPRRGNAFTQLIGRLLFTLLGWRIEGQLPDVPKLVIVGAPHTSIWDAALAVGFFFITGLDCRWMVKKEACEHPLGGLMRWLGAIPVNRQAPGDLVRQVIDEVNRSQKFVIVLTPEGTRKKVARWKTGFYRIALAAGLPVTLAYADFSRQVVGFGPTYHLNGEMEKQIEEMRAYYRNIPGKNPEWA